jgi:hypothetical protein
VLAGTAEDICEIETPDHVQMREKVLWDPAIEKIIKKNENAILKVFRKFKQDGEDPNKLQAGDYITLKNFKLILSRSGLDFGDKLVNASVCASKMTITYEWDASQNQYRDRLVYGEFLESILRVIHAYFEGSEQQELSFREKVLICLGKITQQSGLPFLVEPEAYEQVFSDSDCESTCLE